MARNSTWICFDCRESVRRSMDYAAEVPCPECGQTCTCIGHKLSVPPKRDIKAWRELREWLNERRVAAEQQAWAARVRLRHRLERQIAQLKGRPKNKGRMGTIRLLRRKLAEL